MGRIVAIDVGQKRCGIAATDPLQLIANGLTTVAAAEVFSFLGNYVAKEQVDEFVVGLPKQMNNEPSESMRFVTPFVNRLKKLFPNIPVVLVDERFTSKLAQQTMLQSGLSKTKRQDKALVDQISATIILQSYLESKNNNLTI
jgi:putative Holliday junction resolvase